MIGLFDSGYGGLTIFNAVRAALPQYDYLYVGDNARAPYGTRSFDVVYQFTLEAVRFLFNAGANLVILACNTASAKALRSIQMNDLPRLDPTGTKRVLGIIRPSAEQLGRHTQTRHVGIMATPGTVSSLSYVMEMSHLWPDVHVHQKACPLWVPLVENAELASPGADYFVRKYVDELIAEAPDIDTIMLACTHFPLLLPRIRQFLPPHIKVLTQGGIVADSLSDYLHRHADLAATLGHGGSAQFLTTENPDKFSHTAQLFFGSDIAVSHCELTS